jgi:hypothetical protein
VLAAIPAYMRPGNSRDDDVHRGPKGALRLPRSYCRAGEIATRRSKTGEPVFWPAPKALGYILEAGPEHDAVTLCANPNGRPWTDDGFRASWRKVHMELEQQGRVAPRLLCTVFGTPSRSSSARPVPTNETIADRSAEDNRDGAPLRARCRSETEDAWRCRQL